MTDLTEILYLDCNRQNSVSSATNANEWEYKISEEALVLPKGSQISIQNTLINKRGLSGGSIILDQDYSENVAVCYYHSDNEMWKPIGSKITDPTSDTAEYEDLYSASRQLYSQKTALRTDIDSNPIPIYAGRGDLLTADNTFNRPGDISARRTGFCESPMMMVVRESMDEADVPPEHRNVYDNGFLMPKTNNIFIFIPKGTYGISELAQLIEDQMNGRLRGQDIRDNGDYSTTSLTNKLLTNTYNGMLDNDTTYIRSITVPPEVNKSREPYNNTHIFPFTGLTIGITQLTDTELNGYTQWSTPRGPPYDPIGRTGSGTQADPWGNSAIPNNGYILIPVTQEIIGYETVSFIDGVNPAQFGYGGILQLSNIRRGQFDTPISEIGVHTYFEMWWGMAGNQNPTFIPPSNEMGIFTTPMGFRNIREVLIHSRQGVSKYNQRKFAQYSHNVGDSLYNPQPPPNPLNLQRPLNVGIAGLNLGRNYFRNTNQMTLISHENDDDQAENNTEFDYNPERLGYYVGAPEIKIGYDTTSSSYTINNLHQSWKVPAYDQYGNQIESAGEEAVMLKRSCEVSKSAQWGVGQATLNPHYIHPTIRPSLQQPVQRYGGVAVYNWGVNTARQFGDKDWQNPEIYNQDVINLLTFEEYFTSSAKAREVWGKTIWARLGFTYDQLQSPTSYENNSYYNHPMDDRSRIFGTTTRADLNVDALPSVATSYNPTVSINKDITDHLAPRLYNNLDMNTPIREAGVDLDYFVNPYQPVDKTGNINNIYSYFSSFWTDATAAIILTSGRPIRALNLPVLNEQGYYLITTDILDGHEDSTKNANNMPILGIAPLTSQATNDFINSVEPLIHIINQERIVNSIKFKVLYPNLTNPEIDPNSSILLKIVRPVIQQRQNPQKKT
tara:strand:+ start:525 stop:3218 length:2694 start_codon:yes stop_codon:yes gene_type:complete